MYGMKSKGFRLRVGLDALSNRDLSNGAIAARYAADGIGAEDVAECRKEALPVHKRLTERHGPRYFGNLDIARKPDGVIALLAM